jgi:hypothetical protein
VVPGNQNRLASVLYAEIPGPVSYGVLVETQGQVGYASPVLPIPQNKIGGTVRAPRDIQTAEAQDTESIVPAKLKARLPRVRDTRKKEKKKHRER